MEIIDLNVPKCAVLLAAYNGMQYIEEQIQSILNQVGVHVSLFVSLDRSTDDTELWLNKLARREKRVSLLPYGEKFGRAAKNFYRLIRDVDFSSYDYIAFSDQDDIWHADKLSKATLTLQSSTYDGYSSNVIAFWPNSRKILVNKSQPQKRWDFIFEAAGPGCTYVMSESLMQAIKKRTIEAWDLVQEIDFHDWYCYAFARANGYQWFIDPEPSMQYRQHAQNQLGANEGISAYLNRFKQIKNGQGLKQALLVANAVNSNCPFFKKENTNVQHVNLLQLALHAFQCRRKFSDQLFFLFICFFLAITRLNIQKQ